MRPALAHHGYVAYAATIPEGFQQLQSERYDLVIVSAPLAEENRQRLPAELPTVILDGMVFPIQLLQKLADKLGQQLDL